MASLYGQDQGGGENERATGVSHNKAEEPDGAVGGGEGGRSSSSQVVLKRDTFPKPWALESPVPTSL